MFILNGYKFLYAINLMLILNYYKFLYVYAIDLMLILNDYKFYCVYAIDLMLILNDYKFYMYMLSIFYFWTRALSHSSIRGPGEPKRGLIG